MCWDVTELVKLCLQMNLNKCLWTTCLFSHQKDIDAEILEASGEHQTLPHKHNGPAIRAGTQERAE